MLAIRPTAIIDLAVDIAVVRQYVEVRLLRIPEATPIVAHPIAEALVAIVPIQGHLQLLEVRQGHIQDLREAQEVVDHLEEVAEEANFILILKTYLKSFKTTV